MLNRNRSLFAGVLICLSVVGSAIGQEFPLQTEQHTELGDHRRMWSSVKLRANGKLLLMTRTWTAKANKGFTGGVAVFLEAEGGKIYHTPLQRYGVNGTRLPGPSKREDLFELEVPADMLKSAKLTVYHGLAGKDRFDEIVQKLERASKPVVEIIKALE